MKFKVGDKVERIRGEHGGMVVGDVGTIIGFISRNIMLKEYDFYHIPINFKKASNQTQIE